MSYELKVAECRLYRGGRLLNRLSRFRHFRGHGVHSPYVYSLFRSVFMGSSRGFDSSNDMLSAFIDAGIPRKMAIEILKIAQHWDIKICAIDKAEMDGIIICSSACSDESVYAICEYGRMNKIAVVIMNPYKRQALCNKLLEEHAGTSIDRLHYMILLNNHLPKQHFKL